jgi:trimethylamine:corrinoid methyltransferase-like protein
MASREELLSIHHAAMFILENVGIGDVSPTLCKTYKDLGCKVDAEKGIVKIPQAIAIEAANKIPSTMVMPARNPANDILMEAGSGHTIVGGFGLFSMIAEYDARTRQSVYRDCTRGDMWKYQKVVEYFPEYDMTSMIPMPMDLTAEGLPVDIHETNSTLQCNTKHLWHIDALDHVEEYALLAAEILGGKEELQKRPIITLHTDTPGLTYGKKTSDRIQGCLEGWAKGIPLLTDFTDVCFPGFMGPASITGSYAVTVATSIAEAVALAIHYPGQIPTMTYELVMSVDNYTQESIGALNETFEIAELINIAYWHEVYSAPHAAMSPGNGAAISTNIHAADTQSGYAFPQTSRVIMGGTDQVGIWSTLGMLAIRPDAYAITAEMLNYLRRAVSDVDFSEKAYKLDKWIGREPRGGWDDDEETLELLKDFAWSPKDEGYGLLERRTYLQWLADKKSMDDRAWELTQKIVKEFPNPLPAKDVKERMDKMVAQWDTKYKVK